MLKTSLDNNTAQVYIIDDDRNFRSNLGSAFKHSGFVTREFNTVKNFICWIDYENLPEQVCIVAEVDLVELTGFDLLSVLAADEVAIPTVLMSDRPSIAKVVEGMLLGAEHFMEKQACTGDFVATVKRVLAESDNKNSDSFYEIRQRFASLSERQKEIFLRVYRGEINKSIADQLQISIKTVELHRARMMKKMKAKSLAELIQMAVLINKTSNNLIVR